MWNTLSVNKEFTDKFSVGIDQELRLRDNLSTINLIYTNVGASYKVNDYFKVGLVYRFIDKHKDDFTWGVRHRGYIDLTFRVKPADFTISYRARFQSEWRGYGYEGIYGRVPEIFMRNQVKIAYKINDNISPYIGSEVRWQIQNPRIPYHQSIDRGRFFAGINYEFNKHHTIGSYYLLQKEVNVMDRSTVHVWGLEYTINL
jgi:long-subunit fatty acid transport protein